MKRLWGWLLMLGLAASSGCSSLGFSSTPTAHLMTRQTRDVLEASPRRPDVPRELRQEVLPVHYLQPGDGVLIETVDFDSGLRIPADQRILADGTIDLAEFGRVVVAGMSLEQAEAAIQEILVNAGREPTKINVRLIEPTDRFYVIGEVNSPGSYPLVGNETVLDGLMAAGGLTSRAAVCKMLLARPTDPTSCRVTLPVCYRAITQLGDTTTNYQLRPGDRIFVARQSLMDELTAWCGSKTCSRCCDRDRACGVAAGSATWGSRFGAVADHWLAPPPVAQGGEAGDETVETLPGSPEPAATILDGPAAETMVPGGEEADRLPSPGAPSPGASGELDFGTFLRQSNE